MIVPFSPFPPSLSWCTFAITGQRGCIQSAPSREHNSPTDQASEITRVPSPLSATPFSGSHFHLLGPGGRLSGGPCEETYRGPFEPHASVSPSPLPYVSLLSSAIKTNPRGGLANGPGEMSSARDLSDGAPRRSDRRRAPFGHSRRCRSLSKQGKSRCCFYDGAVPGFITPCFW